MRVCLTAATLFELSRVVENEKKENQQTQLKV